MYNSFSSSLAKHFVVLGNFPQVLEVQNKKGGRIEEMSQSLELQEIMKVNTDEDKELLEKKIWKCKTRIEKEAEIQNKDLLEKKVSIEWINHMINNLSNILNGFL